MTLSPDFHDWIAAHAGEDPSRLRLKYGAARALEILQIESRHKHRAKLAGALERRPDLLFPTPLAGEQSSSWTLAEWHAGLVEPGSDVVDLTAGLGIDLLAMEAHRCHLTAVELDPEVADALRHNFPDATVVCADCRQFVSEALAAGRHFDAVFIDPARRGEQGQRLYALDQCSPDVAAMMPDLLRLATRVIVKASPMLDISHTLAALPSCHHIYATGTPTECKELVAVCACDTPPAEVPVTAVTICAGELTFTRAEEAAAGNTFGIPATGDYVFNPFPAVMKAAPFRLLCELYDLRRLGPNTSLWTAPAPRADFPGRTYRVDEVLPYASRHIKRLASRYPSLGVTTRNFGLDAAALRRKLGLRGDSDTHRLFAVKGPQGEPILIIATRV